ncbi:MAG: hypothetical protein QOE70_3814 [Chthoniobacter sp.]|nr:hypothetical protein [Chthoniobacter sp.]
MKCINQPEHSEFHKQDAFKEYLLCGNCEGRLSVWEGYAREQFFGPNNPFAHSNEMGFVWKGLDYLTMKLFTTSILWRMGISSHPFYYHVQLGKSHEERLRKMLLAEDPKESWRYACSIGFLYYGGKPLGGVFSQPQRTKQNGRYLYRLMIAGMVWFFHVTSHAPPFKEYEGVLQLSGQWAVPTIEALAIPFIKDEIDLFRKTEGTTT